MLYAGVDTGDELAGLRAYSVSATYADALDVGLVAVGYGGGSLWNVGGLMGSVVDASLAPLDGGTVTEANPNYYPDLDASDGLLATTGVTNPSTTAAAGALYLIPAAPIAAYDAFAPGYTFDTATVGSQSGSIAFFPFIAD